MPLSQYGQGEWNFISGAHIIEKLHLDNSIPTCLSRNGILVTWGNLQTSLSTVFIATLFG